MLNPKIKVIGVEPSEAASMKAALKAGEPVTLPSANTIADALLIRSVYKVTDSEIVLWFGIVKSVYKIKDIESIHLFTKTNKLVLYFKDGKYTVIVVKPEWYNDFTKDILAKNDKIRYDVSISDKDEEE